MKKYTVVFLVLMFFGIQTGNAASIDFNGSVSAANLTNYSWVLGSKMWGSIEDGSGAGTSAEGFSSLAGLDMTLFSFTFGDLELTDHLSPGSSSAGYEYYSEGDGSTQAMEFFYDGALWASGSLDYLRIDVDNASDSAAIGFGVATLTSAGVNAAFYNEVLSLTGGSGRLNIEVFNFFPVSNGTFGSLGKISVASVPVPAAVVLFASGLMSVFGFGRFGRRK